MLEVSNPVCNWPTNIQLKLCKYPDTDDIKILTFHVFDSAGKFV